MFPNGIMPGLLTAPPSGTGDLPNLNTPIMQQQMYQRMGNPLPGGLSPPGAQSPLGFGTAGPNMGHNPLSNTNIAAALSGQGRTM